MCKTDLPDDGPRQHDALACMLDQILDVHVSLGRRDVLAHLQTLHPVELAAQVLLRSQVDSLGEALGDLGSEGVAIVALSVEAGLLDVHDVVALAAAEVHHRLCLLGLVELDQLVVKVLEEVAVLLIKTLALSTNIKSFLRRNYSFLKMNY